MAEAEDGAVPAMDEGLTERQREREKREGGGLNQHEVKDSTETSDKMVTLDLRH